MTSTRPLLLARAYYFFFFGAIGGYVPYINLYFQEAGLSGTAIGALAAIPPLTLLVAGPLWGVCADRFRLHRALLPLATLGPILPALLMVHTRHYAGLAVLVACGALFSTAVTALIDSAVIDLVAGTKHTYGTIRVWGSIGFLIVAWLAGYALNTFGLVWLFYGYALLLLLAGLASLGLPARRQTWQVSYRGSLGQLLRQRALVLFLIASFLMGASLQAAYSFFPLYLETLGGDPSWVGAASAIAGLSEMPLIFYSGVLFKRLGVRGAVILAYTAFAVRWALLAVLRSPALVVATNVMHSITFAPFLVGGVAFVEQHTPPGLHATAQGLLTASIFGLGAAVGALSGGWLYDVVGPARIFGLGALVALAATVLVVAADRTPHAATAPAPLASKE